MKTILLTGAGQQSEAIARYLSCTNLYHILIFTRNTTSSPLSSLPNIELVSNPANSGFDIPAFVAAASRSDYVFVNVDSFALGEMADTYWGIRLFELAAGAGVKHLVYSGLDYNGKASGYDRELYVGHYEGKARVQEWMHAQTETPMAWTIIRTGPYIEQLNQGKPMAPTKENGSYFFNLPLKDGAIPFIHLGDLGGYVHWALAHIERSNRLDLGVATVHASGPDIAAALTTVTGKPAKYVDTPTRVWNSKTWAHLPKGPEHTKVGFLSVKDDNALLQTFEENFGNWWHLYQASAGNTGLIRRDYEMLDEILPERVRSVEEWMRKVGYSGDKENTVPNLE